MTRTTRQHFSITVALPLALVSLSCGAATQPAHTAGLGLPPGYWADNWHKHIDELLAMAAPPADWRPFSPYHTRPPPDDAPEDLLVAWWSTARDSPERDFEPGPETVRRLLEALPHYPQYLDALTSQLPGTAAVCHRVAEILAHERQRPDTPITPKQQAWIESWLEDNTPRTDDELAAAVKSAGRNPSHRVSGLVIRIAGEPELWRLLESDRDRAIRLLQAHAAGPDVLIATWARTYLLGHAHDQGDDVRASQLRQPLQAVAVDSSAPALARHLAIQALSRHPWPGQTDWFIARFADESLYDLQVDGRRAHSLPDAAARLGARLVHPVIDLLDDPRTHVRQAAAASLLMMEHPDALRAMLPWLENRQWVRFELDLEVSFRLQFVTRLATVPVPEAVPYLIHMLETDYAVFRALAATTLATGYQAREALPAMRRALLVISRHQERMTIARAMVAVGGVSAREVLSGIEQLAELYRSEESRQRLAAIRSGSINGLQLIVRVTLGILATEQLDVFPENLADEIAGLVVARIDALQKRGETRLALQLRDLVSGWSRPGVLRLLVRELHRGLLGSEGIGQMLTNRELYASNAADELRRVIAAGDEAAGVAAVVLGDDAEIAWLLGDSRQHRPDDADALARDRRMHAALLAAARLAREPIDVGLVTPLLTSPDRRLARAAGLYLEALDTAEAREVLVRRQRERGGDLLILGARENFSPRRDPDDAFERHERQLVDRLQRDPDIREIHALMSFSEEDGARLDAIIEVRAGSARLIHDERERELTREERRAWTSLVGELRVTELPPLISETAGSGGRQLEFLQLTRERGRRVFMIDPGMDDPGSPYMRLIMGLARLGVRQG